MKLRRRLFDPDHARGPSRGADVRMVKRALGRVEQSLLPPRPGGYDDVFNRRMERALDVFRHSTPGLERRRGKPFEQPDLDELEPYFDAYGRWRYRLARVPSPVPKLGPITPGGVPLLDMVPTHATSGLPRYIAADAAWGAGQTVIAPEGLVVDVKDSSANPGEAMYLKGDSELDHWVAHIDRDYPLGHRFERGDFIGKTVPTTIGGGPHAHWAIDGEALLGEGKQFLYGATGTGPDYTPGSPTYRRQLEAALA